MGQITDARLSITAENFKQFKKAWLAAVDAGDAQFVFKGQDVLTSYAKYLVEYWEAK